MPAKRPTGGGWAIFSCKGKVRIPTRAEATTAARRKEGRHAYFCKHCHGWHVAGKPVKPPKIARVRERLRPVDVLEDATP